jgi:hypothetical protein
MDKKQKEMYAQLDLMRSEVPVEWAIVVGKRTIGKIAEHLIMSPAKVEREVEKLIEQKQVQWGAYMGRPILQIVEPDYKEMADFAWKFRQKVLGKDKNKVATRK